MTEKSPLARIYQVTYRKGEKSLSYLSQKIAIWRIKGLALQGFSRGTYYLKRAIFPDFKKLAEKLGIKVSIQALSDFDAEEVEKLIRSASESVGKEYELKEIAKQNEIMDEENNDWKVTGQGFDFYRNIFKKIMQSIDGQDSAYKALDAEAKEKGMSQTELLKIADNALEIIKNHLNPIEGFSEPPKGIGKIDPQLQRGSGIVIAP